MHLVITQPDGRRRDATVTVAHPDATVADLLVAIEAPSAAGLRVRHPGHPPAGAVRHLSATTPLAAAGLADGVAITPVAAMPAPDRRSDGARVDGESGRTAAGRDGMVPPHHLVVVAGAGTGTRLPLSEAGTWLLGRAEDCDLVLDSPTVSAHHARVEVEAAGSVTIADLDSRNGTWHDGRAVTAPTELGHHDTVRLGAVVVRLDGAIPDDRPTTHDPAAGHQAFNRPPREARPAPSGTVTLPEAPSAAVVRQGMRLAALVGPVLMGLVLVWRTGDPRFGAFALVAPIGLVASLVAGRRRARRQRRADGIVFRRALATFADALDAERSAHRRHLEAIAVDVAEVLRRACTPTTRLWERRPDHDDALRLRVGSATLAWRPPVGGSPEAAVEPRVAAIVADRSSLPAAPVTIDLAGGGIVGIVGHVPAGRALARSLLLQAATLQGPADLHVTVLTNPAAQSAWEWSKWLPHTTDPTAGLRHVSADTRTSHRLAEALAAAGQHAPGAAEDADASPSTRMLVVDDPALLVGRDAPTRTLLTGQRSRIAAIVVAPRRDQLPRGCTVVVAVDALGTATVGWPARATTVTDAITAGLDPPAAERAARALAGLEDPEARAVGAALPTRVRLPPLLDLPQVRAAAVAAAWSRNENEPGLATPIGVGDDGTVTLDLRRDGPHVLVGGTTGAGKSELLRTLVAGLAARLAPDQLAFALVDYKGGAAFAECAELPHTVGLVTDLDGHLGDRALQALAAELHRREHVLGEVGAADLPAYLALGAPRGPMPRLVVVIDEFATLAAELPDFLQALVGIAQRGRSLGVHLVLATQRPRGAVDADIRANTNLRIALRVQAASDSNDLLDRPDAAALPRDRPGRAWVRRGADDLRLVQTALVSAPSPGTPAPVSVHPFAFAPTTSSTAPASGEAKSDLQRLVAASNAAAERRGTPPPRRLWLPPLPDHLSLDELPGDGAPADAGVAIGLVDVPREQAQQPYRWRPADGHLALFGMPGQGTSTALRTVAASIARTTSPDACHLYGVDYGGGGLEEVARLPHTGAVVPASDLPRQARLASLLADELERRRSEAPRQRQAMPRIVVLVDGIAAFLEELDTAGSRRIGAAFRRVFTQGAALGVVFAVTDDRPGALPRGLAATVAQRLLLRLADPTGHALAGIPAERLPTFVPGRCVEAGTGRVVQLAVPGDLATLGARCPDPTIPPNPVATLPGRHRLVEPAPQCRTATIRVPVGLADATLEPASLAVHPGDHVLVAGPPRSGKTALLQLLSAQLRAATPRAVQVAVCDPARSDLAGWPSLDGHGTVDELAALGVLDAAAAMSDPWWILVDDADLVADDRRLEALVSTRAGLHLVAAGRAAAMKAAYGSWLRQLRASRTGVLLQPDPGADGALLSVDLPARSTTPLVTGRGYLVSDGACDLVQFALPPHDPPPAAVEP